MGTAHEGAPAAGLLPQHPARRDGRRYHGFMRDLFRHNRRPGLRVQQFRRFLDSHCARSSRSAFGRGPDAQMIRVGLPFHLRTFAKVDGEVLLDVPPPVTQRAILEALEAKFPVLRGMIRDFGTLKRRPLVRYYACEEDLSFEPPDAPVPEEVASGAKPFLIIGAMSGG